MTCQHKQLSILYTLLASLLLPKTKREGTRLKICAKRQYGVSIKGSVKLRDGSLSNLLLGAIISSYDIISDSVKHKEFN
uniref:Uncharacterized protein n=1 Tax=Setaria italica TaxID=4555 RepID=K3YXB2_SETIT